MKIQLLPQKDYDHYLEHLIRLNHQSKMDRFGHAASSTWLKNYVLNIPEHDYVLGVRAHDGELIGAVHIAELESSNDQIKEAEFGLSVLEDQRNQGVGSLLIESAILFCATMEYRYGWVLIHDDNVPMQRLAMKFQAELKTRMGEVFACFPIVMSE